jgi:hypothetical protein
LPRLYFPVRLGPIQTPSWVLIIPLSLLLQWFHLLYSETAFHLEGRFAAVSLRARSSLISTRAVETLCLHHVRRWLSGLRPLGKVSLLLRFVPWPCVQKSH